MRRKLMLQPAARSQRAVAHRAAQAAAVPVAARAGRRLSLIDLLCASGARRRSRRGRSCGARLRRGSGGGGSSLHGAEFGCGTAQSAPRRNGTKRHAQTCYVARRAGLRRRRRRALHRLELGCGDAAAAARERRNGRGNAARRAPASSFAACCFTGDSAGGGTAFATGSDAAGFGAGGDAGARDSAAGTGGAGAAGASGGAAGAGGTAGGVSSSKSPSSSNSDDGATGLPIPPASLAAAHTGGVAAAAAAAGDALGCCAAAAAAAGCAALAGCAAQRLQKGTPSRSCSRPGTAGLSLQPHCAHARHALCHSPPSASTRSAAYTVSPHLGHSAMAPMTRRCGQEGATGCSQGHRRVRCWHALALRGRRARCALLSCKESLL